MAKQMNAKDRDRLELKQLREQMARLEEALAGSFATVTGLRESETKYRDLFDNAMDAIFIVDGSHRFADVNRRATELFGFSREEFLAMGIFDVIPPEQAERSAEALRRLTEQGRYERFRGKMRTRDGRWREIEVNSSAIILDGRVVGSRDIVRDVTEQVGAEQRLREEKNRSEAIIAAIGDGVSIQDADYRILYQNEVHKGFIGDHVGEYCYRAYESKDRTCDDCPVALSFRDGRVHTTERAVAIRGEMRHFEITGSPLRDAAGAVIAGIEVVRDVTARNRAAEELRESQRSLAMLTSNLPGMAYRCRNDREWTMEFVSEGARTLTGYGPGDLVNNRVIAYSELIRSGDREAVWRGVQDALRDRRPFTLVYRIRTREQEERWVWERGQGIFSDQGALLALEGFITDITDRMLAEESLRNTVEKYRTIFENASVSLWEEDFAAVMEEIRLLRSGGVTDFRGYFRERPEEAVRIASLTRIVDVNDYTLKLYGAASKEELMRSLHQFLTPDSAAAAQEIIIAMAEGRTWFEAETTNRTLDGRLLDILITINIPTESSSFRNCLVSITDITAFKQAAEERRRLQTQLLQSQKLEAVGLLAGGIAHDFNNILSAILGYAGIIEMKLQPGDPLRGHVEQVIGAVHRAAGLVQSLLAFSRKQIIDPRPLELTAAIQRIEKLLRRLIGEDIEFRTEYHDRLLTVVADPVQLEQVVINLVTNARDAMPGGGMLTLATAEGGIGEEFLRTHGFGLPGRYAVLSAADTGSGMDEGTKAHIFEPFFTTKEQGKGSGLGLSTVYGIVKQNNGFIICESAPGAGAVFRVYLPLAGVEAAAPAVAAAPDQPDLRGAETVLIAEDDDIARELFRAVFEEHGYAVVTAGNGEEALARFRERPDGIDLLVLDVIMPRMNGRTVLEEARRIRPDVRALFTSGYTADIIHARGILDPSIEFLAKPVLPSDLLKKAREVLDGA